jgi:hypothetical protein
LDDDEIAERLRINRHYVNTICRELQGEGVIVRSHGSIGKITNIIAGSAPSLPKHEPIPKPTDGRRRTRRSERARQNVEALVASFSTYVSVFEASEAFRGPSLYFHERALERRQMHGDVASLFKDERFFEYVYAVLPAWGMHRMGMQRAKVGTFNVMVQSFRACRSDIERLWTRSITAVAADEALAVAEDLWSIISRLRVSTSGTRIVAGSKALHHVLPELVPPIDRQYTFRFFTGQKSVTDERGAFLEWFPYFCRIGRECEPAIDAVLARRGFMATGPAKTIDNAIMGFMQAAKGV